MLQNKKWIPQLVWGFVLLVFLWHWVIIVENAIDIPYWDEWDELPPSIFWSMQNLNWIFLRHSEHMIVPTKVLTAVLYQLNHWDLKFNQLVNFGIYGATVASVVWVFKKVLPTLQSWICVGFCLMLLSGLPSENHQWGFQSQFHFVILFFILSTGVLFFSDRSLIKTCIGSIFGVLSILSFSSGVVSGLMLLCVYGFYVMMKRDKLSAAVVGTSFGVAIAYWFSSYHQISDHPERVTPFQPEFWKYFVNLVSYGFGFQSLSVWLGFFCLALVLVPLIGIIWRRRFRWTASEATVITLVLGILASLATITMGRAGPGPLGEKISRYGEIAVFLVPFTVMSWCLYLGNAHRYRRAFLAFLWSFALVGSLNDWGLPGGYRSRSWIKIDGYDCVKNHFLHAGTDYCPTIYPVQMSYRLTRARELKLSFFTKLTD